MDLILIYINVLVTVKLINLKKQGSTKPGNPKNLFPQCRAYICRLVVHRDRLNLSGKKHGSLRLWEKFTRPQSLRSFEYSKNAEIILVRSDTGANRQNLIRNDWKTITNKATMHQWASRRNTLTKVILEVISLLELMHKSEAGLRRFLEIIILSNKPPIIIGMRF